MKTRIITDEEIEAIVILIQHAENIGSEAYCDEDIREALKAAYKEMPRVRAKDVDTEWMLTLIGETKERLTWLYVPGPIHLLDTGERIVHIATSGRYEIYSADASILKRTNDWPYISADAVEKWEKATTKPKERREDDDGMDISYHLDHYLLAFFDRDIIPTEDYHKLWNAIKSEIEINDDPQLEAMEKMAYELWCFANSRESDR